MLTIRVFVLGSTASPCKSNSTSSVGTIKPISGREDRPAAGEAFFLLWTITGFFIGSRGADDDELIVVVAGGDSVVDLGGGATVVVVAVLVVGVGVLVTANVLSGTTF